MRAVGSFLAVLMSPKIRGDQDMSVHTLRVTHGTSRGVETYGYNIVTVTDMQTGKRYRCMGGGYDMLGTSFAEWLQEAYQAELIGIADQAHSITKVFRETNEGGWYGMHSAYYSGGERAYRVTLDGACGLSSIERIAREGLGLTITHEVDRRGNVVGFVVTDES